MVKLQRAEFKDPLNNMKKWYSVVFKMPTCFYTCLTTSGHAHLMRQWTVSWRIPDLDVEGNLQIITELLDSLRWNLENPNIRCDTGFRSGERGGSQWYQFLYPPETTYILSPIEARHCCTWRTQDHSTGIGSDSGSMPVEVFDVLNMPPQTITHPPPNHSCRKMLQATLTVFTASPDTFTSVTCAQGESALICQNHREPVVDLPILIFYSKCESGSTMLDSEHRPTRGCWACRSPL